jgi:hypothetical protein
MTLTELQQRLTALGVYTGAIDGRYGPATRTALQAALARGPDTPVTAADVSRAAAALSTTPAHIRTVRDVEAAGAGFANGLPKILFEGHIFSRLTGGRYDRTNPAISYPKWDRSKYPGTQQGRYNQLLDAVGLDVDAAFSAASYGAFQILGQNYRVCGFATPFDFVMAQADTEGAQLIAFINFIRGNRLDDALRNGRWAEFARGYNGSAYKANQYDVKLAQAFAKEQALDHTQPPPPAPATGLSGTCRITAKLNLRAAPGGDVLGVVDAGGFVNVIRDLGDWCEVNYAPGKNGYMLSQFLTKA